MTIRQYGKSDRSETKKMFVEFYDSDAVLHKIDESCFESTLDEVEKGSPFVGIDILEFDGKAVGYALATYTFSSEVGGKSVWLEELYIREAVRGKGIGKNYLTEFLKRHDAYSRIRLETEPDNFGAAKLYKTFGFEELKYTQYVKDTLRK